MISRIIKHCSIIHSSDTYTLFIVPQMWVANVWTMIWNEIYFDEIC